MKMSMTQFFRLTIARKLLLGFLSCAILSTIIALLSLSNLQRLKEINNRIIKRDIPLAETANQMIETMLAQDLYGRRSLTLARSGMEGLFWKRSNEFETLQKQIANLPDSSSLSLHRLAALHEEYNDLYKIGYERRRAFSSSAFRNHERQMRSKREEIFGLLKEISRYARKDQDERNLETLSIGHSAFYTISALSIGSFLLAICISVIIMYKISRSIKLLELSTRQISEGEFDHLPQVRNHDELGDLFWAFQGMAQRLKVTEESRERLIQSLKDSLLNIKRLQGMLPICASCKKIRDDKGYWNRIENYIAEHSEAEFTHGLCPDCMKKLYGNSLSEDSNRNKE
jgi:methyl-accepting chemotaxis protein